MGIIKAAECGTHTYTHLATNSTTPTASQQPQDTLSLTAYTLPGVAYKTITFVAASIKFVCTRIYFIEAMTINAI
jgi:hypothetical protein